MQLNINILNSNILVKTYIYF